MSGSVTPTGSLSLWEACQQAESRQEASKLMTQEFFKTHSLEDEATLEKVAQMVHDKWWVEAQPALAAAIVKVNQGLTSSPEYFRKEFFLGKIFKKHCLLGDHVISLVSEKPAPQHQEATSSEHPVNKGTMLRLINRIVSMLMNSASVATKDYESHSPGGLSFEAWPRPSPSDWGLCEDYTFASRQRIVFYCRIKRDRQDPDPSGCCSVL